MKEEFVAFFRKHSTYSKKIDYDLNELLHVIEATKAILSTESTLVEVPAPVVIVGDVHGQYRDLHRIFAMCGTGQRSGALINRFLFLGDYVDRGTSSLETICCLIAHKLIFPNMFVLLRGNHESAFINSVYGFLTELQERFTDKSSALIIWKAFNELFNLMPLAALVQGKILAMHGGLGPDLHSLNDIRKIPRPLDDPNSIPLAQDLLWADPMVGLRGFLPNSARGLSVYFGEDVVMEKCKKLNIDMIVMLNGYGLFCGRRLVTVFSAPCYSIEKNNIGAVMIVSGELHVGFRLLASLTHGEQRFRQAYRKNARCSNFARLPGKKTTVSARLEAKPDAKKKRNHSKRRSLRSEDK